MYPNRTPLGLVLKDDIVTLVQSDRGHQDMPFYIVLFLSVDDALHQPGIPEERNG